MINKVENRNKVAIVAVGYNRLDSMRRLLSSLSDAYYDLEDIPLVISIDNGGNEQLIDFVNNFQWNYGDKYVILHKQRLGLREHIFSCGDLSQYFKAVIVLEDDLFVSPYFYDYVMSAVNFYENDTKAACIALYSKIINENTFTLPFLPYKTEYDVYATQTVITWGQCWTSKMWLDFRNWLKENPNIDWSKYDMPERIKQRKRAWSNFYYAYLLATEKYVISPYESYTTCFADVGEHNSSGSTVAQVPIVMKSQSLNFARVDDLSKYDSFMNNKELGRFIEISDEDLCVDLYGDRNNDFNKRYILSINILPYKILKSYGLQMRPIEVNVIRNIEGQGIYLYDTHCERRNLKKSIRPIKFLHYYFCNLLISNIAIKYIRNILTNKIVQFFKR